MHCYHTDEELTKSIEEFAYDADGYMIKRAFYNQADPSLSFEEFYVISNGLLKKKTYVTAGLPLYESRYTYGTTRNAYMLQTSYAIWISPGLFGKTWTRVPTAVQTKNIQLGNIIEDVKYLYNTDNDDYVTSRTVKNEKDFTVSTTTIDY